jgi:predicted PurR-regulated permease PerM
MTVILAWLLGISVFVIVALSWGIRNLLKQNESYENYFEDLNDGLQYVLTQIKTVDRTGAFEVDDEVGLIFKGIKGMVDSLSAFLISKEK